MTMFCRRDFYCVAWLHVIRSPSLDQWCCSMPQLQKFVPLDRWSLHRIMRGARSLARGTLEDRWKRETYSPGAV